VCEGVCVCEHVRKIKAELSVGHCVLVPFVKGSLRI